MARVLVLEDEWLIAAEYASRLQAAGHEVVGPYRSVRQAVAAIEATPIDAALLDVNLGDETSLPVAMLLQQRDIRFAFLTGAQGMDLPPELVSAPILAKPVLARMMLEFVAKTE